ncbi:unnamed protein product [Lota lota]
MRGVGCTWTATRNTSSVLCNGDWGSGAEPEPPGPGCSSRATLWTLISPAAGPRPRHAPGIHVNQGHAGVSKIKRARGPDKLL